MPALDWIGKNKVINHHLDVPYKILEKQYTFNEENGFLNEEVSQEKIREYIWFTESGKKFEMLNQIHHDNSRENQYFLGNNHNSAYWFYYEKNKATTLDMEFLGTIKGKYEQYIIYADICLLPKEFMLKNNIIFKKIPRDIKKF